MNCFDIAAEYYLGGSIELAADQTLDACRKKPGSSFDPGFKRYPADAVQADHPFPSVTGG